LCKRVEADLLYLNGNIRVFLQKGLGGKRQGGGIMQKKRAKKLRLPRSG